jgi:hypothetical protein
LTQILGLRREKHHASQVAAGAVEADIEELVAKRLELLRELIPQARVIGVLSNPTHGRAEIRNNSHYNRIGEVEEHHWDRVPIPPHRNKSLECPA